MEEERPRFRRDLDTRPLEVDGIGYVDATDPRSGNVFRFYDFEHAVAEVLDGRALDELLTDARERSGLYLTTRQLAQFSEKLRELGFLEAGDDDQTSAGPAPAGMLDNAPTAPGKTEPPEAPAKAELPELPEVPELDEALAAAAIPPGSTEKLPVLGGTDRVVPIGSTEKLPTLETVAYKEPEEEPAKEPEDPALAARSGELRSASPRPEPVKEPEAPPPEAAVVAPDLEDEAPLPGSDDPTKSVRRDDLVSASAEPKSEPFKNTLFGMPFQAVGPEPRPQAPSPPPDEPAVAGPEPASPVPPAPSRREVAPAPPAATPPPAPALAVTAEMAPLAKTEEVAPLGKTAEVAPVGETNGHPQGKSAVVHPLGSAETPPLGSMIEVPALVPSAPRPSARLRGSPMVFAAAGVLLAGVIGFLGYRHYATTEQGPVAVRTVSPAPGTAYRWFEATGTVKTAGERTLTFTTGGKVVKVAGPGTSFHPGDVIAEVEGAPQFKQAADHNKQRLAYYEQRLEQMTKEGNRPEMRQAELKIAEKKKLIAEAEAGLSRQGVIASGAGEISAALVKPGEVVKAGAPAAKVKGTDWRAEFELSRDDAGAVRRLGFCRVEVAGKQFECSLSPEGGDESHVFLDLPSEPGIAAGKPVHLARARYDAAFVLPATALAPTKGSDRRVYVVKDGRAESYAVVLADQTPTEIVVTQGLEPGSAVVAEVPPALKPRSPVKATPK